MSKFLSPVRLVLISTFVADLVFVAWFGDLLITTHKAVASGGFDTPFAAHGDPVFITRGEYLTYWGAWDLLFVIFAMIAAIEVVAMVRTRNKPGD